MKILRDGVDLDAFFAKIQNGSLILLDYDGTLAPFVEERMQACPYVGVKERLEMLAHLKHTRVVIVSGRSLADLERLLEHPSHLELWGSHGLERKLVDGGVIRPQLDDTLREAIKEATHICQEHVDAKYCESKPFAVALHWRAMSDKQLSLAKVIESRWQTIASTCDLELHHFDGGVELRPKGRNKGDVVDTLLNEMPTNCAVAYLGDDMTDEEAFASLAERGLKVLVRNEWRPTLADIHLTPPKDLLAFLDRWSVADE